MKNTIVTSSKEIMGGTPVFAETRVPIQNLIDYLAAGDSIDEFLEGFPTVKREQVVEFLERIATIEALKPAIEEMKQGKGESVEKVFAEI